VASRGVLYIVVCAAPAASGVEDLVLLAQAAGWRVYVIATPLGLRFVDADRLASLTGEPVRTEWRMPGFGVPIVAVPLLKDALARHVAFGPNLDALRSMGVRVLFDPSAPPDARMPPWEQILTELAALRAP
jgi:hypothetical protein